jgi:hypothetical protein
MAILDDTRSDWDARPPTGTLRTVPWDQRVGVSWHWIGPGRGIPASSSHSLCLELVNRWQLQHQTRVGDPWKDIGYNALICQHARTVEGRGLTFQGSHSPGVNWEHIGVQFMVGDAGISPTPQMVARAQFLRADLAVLGKNIRRDWGHRDDPEASTTCPGDVIERWVKAGGPTATPQKEDDMAITVKNPQTGAQWPIEDALWSMWTYTIEGRNAAREAARDAAVARALAEAAAKTPDVLTAEEVDAIAERVGSEFDERFTVLVQPTPEVPA